MDDILEIITKGIVDNFTQYFNQDDATEIITHEEETE